MLIKKIKAKKILDSNKDVTIQLAIKTDKGKGIASVPNGNEMNLFSKNGIDATINFINNDLNNTLKDFQINNFNDFEKLEEHLKKFDNTENLEIIGRNTLLALEYAILKALYKKNVWKFLNPSTKQLPRPLTNLITSNDFKEFLTGSLNSKNFSKAADINSAISSVLKRELRFADTKFIGNKKNGAWYPNLSIEEILTILKEVTNKASKQSPFSINIGIDVNASNLFNYDTKKYDYKNFSIDEQEKSLSQEEQINFISYLIEKFNLIYVEDPLHEEDFKGYSLLKKIYGHKCLIAADKLTLTNIELLKKAIENDCINAVVIKPNQIGSLVKIKKIIDLAKENKLNIVLSERSGETKDTMISHLAIAFDIPIIKLGILGKERISKIKEINKIEKQIKKSR